MADRRPRELALRGLAEVSCVLAPACAVFALGGASAYALPLLSFFAAAALLCCSLLPDGLKLPRPGLILAAGATCAALQLIPLPASLHAALSPTAAELIALNVAPLGLSTTRPITLDPAATARALAASLALLSLLVSAARLSRDRGARSRLAWAVAAMGTAVALIAAGHAAVGATSLFGVHSFSVPQAVLTPFGNPNHLCGFLIVTATVTLGLLVDERRQPVQAALALAYLSQAALTAFTSSRAGIAAFVAAQGMFAVLVALQKSRRGRGGVLSTRKLLALGLATLALLIGGAFAWDGLLESWQATASVDQVRASKLSLWPQFARAAGPFVRAGMGRGTFELGYATQQRAAEPFTFAYPENVVLQLLCELGAPATLGLLLLSGWVFWTLLRRREPSVLDQAALAATCGVVLHNLFDFSLELAAVPAMLMLVLGTLSRRPEEAVGPRTRRLAPVLAAGVAVALLLCLRLPEGTWTTAEQQLQAQLGRGAKAVTSAALPLIDRHPFDSVLFADVGLSQATERDGAAQDALSWLNRGLRLSPFNPAAHEAAARALLRLGRRNQAFLEYRLALEAMVDQPPDAIVADALARARTLDELSRLCPREVPLAQRIAEQVFLRGRPDDARALLKTVALELPAEGATDAWLEAAAFDLQRNDLPAAEASVARAEALSKGELPVLLARATLLQAEGRTDEALSLIKAELVKHPGDLRAHLALCEAQAKAGQFRDAAASAARGRTFASSPDERARLFTVEADAWKALGRPARGVEAAEAAARLKPQDAYAHYVAGELNALLGRYAEARRWFEEGAKVDAPTGADAARKRIAELSSRESRHQAVRDPQLLDGVAPAPDGEKPPSTTQAEPP